MASDHQLAVPPQTPSCSPTVPHLPLVQLSHDSWPGPSRSLPHHPTSDLGRWGTSKFPEAPDSLGSPPLLPVDPVQLRLDCLNFSGGWVGIGEHDYLGPGSEHQLAAHWLCPGAECQCPWGRGQARADGSRARCGQHIFPGRPGCGLAVGVGSGPPAGPAAGLVRVEFEAVSHGLWLQHADSWTQAQLRCGEARAEVPLWPLCGPQAGRRSSRLQCPRPLHARHSPEKPSSHRAPGEPFWERASVCPAPRPQGQEGRWAQQACPGTRPWGRQGFPGDELLKIGPGNV